MNQALKSRVANFTKNSMEYEVMQFSCDMKSNLTVLDAIKDWRFPTEVILNVSQSCERMLLDCTFGGVSYNCTDLFQPVLLDEGLCCTFNSLDPVYRFKNISNQFAFNTSYPPNVKPVDYSLENGYQNPLPEHYSPMRAIGYGITVGLSVVLNVDSDEYYCSTSNSIGFKLSIHNPEVMPDIRENGLLLPPGQESFVRLLPTQLIAHKKLRNLSRKQRNCLFEEESKLNVFSYYSYENCVYECRTEILITHCGCIPPHIYTKYSNFTVCSYKEWPCFLRANYLSKRNDQFCGQQCLPKCFSKSFKVDIFSAKLNKTFLEISSPIIANMSSAYVDKNIAVARFYLNQYNYESTIKSPYIDAIDVLEKYVLIHLNIGLNLKNMAI
ncbi:pickpocket protein 28-like isoform X2 [Ceratitis capitata]|uniref:pickpocket protein 28-like isoform X2 n=1 Tax=Ceratitis capitata TaxID=7213 RepID=UPI000C6C50C3|nr:pickpocket protein 28-like isoform X2 [Ceratitis capitata]